MPHPIIRLKRGIRVYEMSLYFLYHDHVWVSHLLIIASCDLFRLVSSRWDVGEQRGSPSQLTSAKSPSSPPDESRSDDHLRADYQKTESIIHKFDNTIQIDQYVWARQHVAKLLPYVVKTCAE